MAWILSSKIRFRSILKYHQISGVHSTIRQFVVDETAGRAWLIHDSGLWKEGALRDGQWLFLMDSINRR